MFHVQAQVLHPGFTVIADTAVMDRMGGNPVSSVSGSTDFVVVGGNPGSKYDKAKQLKIRIIKENEFFRLCDSVGAPDLVRGSMGKKEPCV